MKSSAGLDEIEWDLLKSGPLPGSEEISAHKQLATARPTFSPCLCLHRPLGSKRQC